MASPTAVDPPDAEGELTDTELTRLVATAPEQARALLETEGYFNAEVSATRELFKSALQVLEGAFRFTTDVAAKARKREVTVRVDQVTIGIRGTDFWGRSRAERQIVCLIEGAIQVGADGEPQVTMDQPRQFYRREKGKTEPVGMVEAQQLAQWALETDIGAGKGALRRGGKFSVALLKSSQQREANGVRDQLRQAGYPAEVVSDKQTYTVRIRHLPTREEAQVLADQLEGKFGVKEPQVVQ